MRAPWYTDVHKQAQVMNRVADSVYGTPDAVSIVERAQERIWNKFDLYMLRRSIN